jgi:hypothetical protein
VGLAHPASGFGQLAREAESVARACRATREELAAGSELDQRPVEINRAECMLDDVGDGAESDVVPPVRHEPHLGRAERGTGYEVGEQVRYLVLDDQAGVAASGHRLLVRGGRHHRRAGHRAQHAGQRRVPLGGQLDQRPHGRVDRELVETGRCWVGGGEPRRTPCQLLERIPGDHEHPQRISHPSLGRGQRAPRHAQLEELLLGDRRCRQQLPDLVGQVRQQSRGHPGHPANVSGASRRSRACR